VHDESAAGTNREGGPGPAAGAPAWRSLEDSLHAVTSTASRTIGWADHVTVSLSYSRTAMDTFGATDPVALKVDALQWELGEGPSVDAVDAGLVHVSDLVADGRWPGYATRATELGVTAQTSVRLTDENGTVGVLTLYSKQVHELDEATEALIRSLAVQATSAVTFASRLQAQTEAIRSRQVIGQAIGIVMERQGLDESRAFDHLVHESQRTQVKLRVIARELVEETNARSVGTAPADGTPSRSVGDDSGVATRRQ
jgi:hypothetical protein